jgi:VanZ family protein
MSGGSDGGSWPLRSLAMHRRRLLWLVPALVATLVVSLSAEVARVWGDLSHGRRYTPAPIADLLARRPHIDEADTHAVLWFVLALGAVSLVRTRRQRTWVLVALWLFGALVEVLQEAFTTRSAEWGDLAGNTVGVLAAAAVVWCRGRRPRPG